MIVRALALAALLATFPSLAFADTPPVTYTVVNVTTATTVKTGPGQFYGVISTVTQTTAVTCYDNTAASGTALWVGTPTPTAPSVGIPSSGIQYLTGLTCIIATSVVAPGYTILWK